MNPIISELKIDKYRGINGLELTDLSTINVLAGVNNSGKTSILEVIGLLSNPASPGTMVQWLMRRAPQNPRLRKNNQSEYISSAFRKGDLTKVFEIKFDSVINNIQRHCFLCGDTTYRINASGVSQKMFVFAGVLIPSPIKYFNENFLLFQDNFSKRLKKSLEKAYEEYENNTENTTLEYEDDPIRVESLAIRDGSNRSYPFKYTPLFSVSSVFTEDNYYLNCVRWIKYAITNEEKKPEIMSVLSRFDSTIDDISIIDEDIYLHSSYAGTQPLFSYGSGLQKAVLLISLLLGNSNGVVLVDEIDNALNISAFSDVFSWFIKMCRELNIQAFVTTHSIEAIDAILEATEDDEENGLEDDVRIITLRKLPKSHQTVAKIRTGKTARYDRERCEMEMRI